MKEKTLSPERIYLKEAGKNPSESELKHISRYRFANMNLKRDSVILDCACGSGYGTRILSKRAKEITGVDIDKTAIDFANENNKFPNTNYIQKDIAELIIPKNTYDCVVSFETLEHIEYDLYIDFISKIRESMGENSMAILSSPMLRYDSNGIGYVTNPYHINELPRSKLVQTIKRAFHGCSISFYRQYVDCFMELTGETTGFLIMVIRRVK